MIYTHRSGRVCGGVCGGVCDDSTMWTLHIFEQGHAVLEGRSQAEKGRDEPVDVDARQHG